MRLDPARRPEHATALPTDQLVWGGCWHNVLRQVVLILLLGGACMAQLR